MQALSLPEKAIGEYSEMVGRLLRDHVTEELAKLKQEYADYGATSPP